MIGALVVLCGDATPGSRYSATKKVGALSALQRLAIVLGQAGVGATAIVTGRPPNEAERQMEAVGVPCRCFSAPPPAGAAQALQPAAAYLESQCARILLVRGDVPLFCDGTVQALLQSKTAPAVPVCGGTPGWPVLVPASWQLPGASRPAGWDALPAGLLAAGAAAVPVADGGTLLRLDSEPTWEALLAEHRCTHFRPVTKLTIAREDTFLGPGIYRLLCALRDTGSVRDACEKIGLSYSKGWRIIRNLEYQAGFEVVLRHKGGQAGGHSHLSPRGEQLLADYAAYVKACEAAIRPIFERYFGHGPG